MEEIRVCGRVQGVGFRPTVYRLAKACKLKGEVCNDGEGVLIRVVGNIENIDKFVQRLQAESPPLAKIEKITRNSANCDSGWDDFTDFVITHSVNSAVKTEISPDAATCGECQAEIFDPLSRWYRYPFTNCTHCGPRLSIIHSIPYDRNNTSMASFPICPDCAKEYQDVENRRFHAQPIACPLCGPKIWLERGNSTADAEVGNGEEEISITSTKFSPLNKGGWGGEKKIATNNNPSDIATNATKFSPLDKADWGDEKKIATNNNPSDIATNATKFSPLNKAGWGDEKKLATNNNPSDTINIVSTLLKQGKIIAIKGLGGIHLACDATNETAVQKLRSRKQRYHKPFALMARDISIIEQYCYLNETEKELLKSAAAPIVLIPQKTGQGNEGKTENLGERLPPIAPSVAPNQTTLGFMLPYTPLHHLILQNIDPPIVLTSGNLSDEPQCIDNEEARIKLGKIADYLLLHNRDIINRIDDSVVRVIEICKNTTNYPAIPEQTDSRDMLNNQNVLPTTTLTKHTSHPYANKTIQILRRARGYAPAPINLPDGFQNVPHILAMGGELKNTFCLLRDGKAILSQHLGDLENGAAFSAYQNTLELYLSLFDRKPIANCFAAAQAIAIDKHPEYLSSKLGKEIAAAQGLKLYSIQHHHAHIAACLVENGIPFDAPPVLGIALDGLGYGDDGTFWGGEFLLADYRGFKRLGMFKPVAMIGGAQAIYQPWRNTYSQLMAGFTWAELQEKYGNLELLHFLDKKPRALLNQIIAKGINSPLTSSAGRLFDGVAAAMGICREESSYEGQAAIEMEGLVNREKLNNLEEYEAYPIAIRKLDSQESWDMQWRQMDEKVKQEGNKANRGEDKNGDVPYSSTDDSKTGTERDRKINDTIAISSNSDSDTKLLYLETRPLWQSILDDLKDNIPKSVIATKFHQGLAKAIVNMVNQLSHHHFSNRVVLTGGVFQNRILLEEVSSRLAAEGIVALTHNLVPPNDGSLSLGQSAIAAAIAIDS